MPTIGEILTDIDNARYPNVFTTAQKIVWANEILRKIYKHTNNYFVSTIPTVDGNSQYSLSSLLFENILSVKIDGVEYEHVPIFNNELNSNCYYKGAGEYICIYPAPTQSGLDIDIYYVATPTLLNSSTLEAIPSIKEEYHSLITNYICMIATTAGPNPDTEMYNIFATQFNNDWDRFVTDWAKTRVKQPKKKYCNRWW